LRLESNLYFLFDFKKRGKKKLCQRRRRKKNPFTVKLEYVLKPNPVERRNVMWRIITAKRKER